MTLPDLNGKATLNVAEWRQGINTVLSDLKRVTDLGSRSNTIRITAALADTSRIKTDVDRLTSVTRKPITIPITLDAPGLNRTKSQLSETDQRLKDLRQSVAATRSLWQTQILTDDQAAASSRRLRDELLRLAAAEGTSADQIGKAAAAAAQAQRTLDQSQGQITKGGFAANASLGILSALQSLGGPLGSAAGLLGDYINKGLEGGMKAGRPQVGKGAQDLGDEVIGALRKKLDIHSPSVVMEGVGRNIVDGLVLGLKRNTADVIKEAEKLGSAIPDAVQGASDGTTGPVASPTAELLDVIKSQLEEIPKVFEKTNTETQTEATDLGAAINEKVAPALDGLKEKVAAGGESLGEFTPKLKNVSEEGKGAADELANIGDEAAGAGNNFEKFAGFLTVGLAGITAFVTALSVTIPQAAEFQASLANISTESDLTTAQLAQLGDGLLQTAGKVGVSAQELAKAAYDVVGAGVAGAETVQQINKLTEISAKAASAGLTDTATAANVITGALNAYGLSADKAQHVSDVLFKTTGVGKITFEQIASSMGVLFPLASTLGVNLEELSGSVATLTSVGVPAEQAVTGLQNVLSNVLKPSSQATELAGKLGIRFDATALQAKGLARFLQDVTKATGGSQEKMAELFGSTEAVNAVFALTSGSGSTRLTKTLHDLAEASGATDAAFAKQADTFKFAQQQYQTSIEALQIQFGLKFLPTITKLASTISGFLANGQGLKQFFDALPGYVIPATLAVLAFRAQATLASVLRFNPATFAEFFGLVTGGFTRATAAARAFVLSNPVGIIAAAAAAVAIVANKIISDTNRIREETNQQDNDTFAGVIAQVHKLEAAGDAVSRVKGKILLAVQQLSDANQGVASTDLFGKTTYTVDPKKVEEAAARLKSLRIELANVTAQQGMAAAVAKAHGDALAGQAEQVHLTDDELKKQVATIKSVRDALAGRPVIDLKATQLQQDMSKVQNDFRKLREQLQADVKDPVELKVELRNLSTHEQAELSGLRAKAAQDAAASARTAADAAVKAEIEAMAEGRPKVLAQRHQQEVDLQRSLDTQLKALRDFPDRQREVEASGREQLAAMRQGWAREDEAEAKATALRIVEARQTSQEAQVTAEQAAGEARVSLIKLQEARALDAVKGNIQEEERVRKQFAAALQHEQQGALDRQYQADRARLSFELGKTLSDEKLTAQERQSIIATYYQNIGTLDSKYRTDVRTNAAASEQEERDRLERLRAARVAADFKPVADRESRLKDLQDSAALLTSASDLLLNQREQQRVRVQILAAQDKAIGQARADGATQVEINKAVSDRKGMQQQVLKGELDIAAAAEKQRAAHAAIIARPVTIQLAELEFQKQLATSTAEQLRLEQEMQGPREELARQAGENLRQAILQKGSQQEINDLTDQQTEAQHNVELGQKAILDAQKQLTEEATSTIGAVRSLQTLLAGQGQSEVVQAQQTLARSVQGVGEAYDKARPFLDAMRSSQGLATDQLKPAGDAITGLVSALQAEQQALDALRGKWEAQQSAVAGILGVIADLRTATGDQALLQQNVADTTAAMVKAQQALATVGSDPVAAQKAAQDFQNSYRARVAAVQALGDAQAKVYDDEAARLERQQQAQTKVLQAQIDARKLAGATPEEITKLEAARDKATAGVQGQIDQQKTLAETTRTATQTQVDGINKGLIPVLGQLQQVAKTAQLATDATGQSVKDGEKTYQDALKRIGSSADTMVSQLKGVLSEGGYAAGQSLAQQLAAGYRASLPATLPAPGISYGARPAGPGSSAGGGDLTVNFNVNGVPKTAPQDLRQLAVEITPYIRQVATDNVRKGAQ